MTCTIDTLRDAIIDAIRGALPSGSHVHDFDPFTNPRTQALRNRIVQGDQVHVWYIESFGTFGGAPAAEDSGLDMQAQVRVIGLLGIGDDGTERKLQKEGHLVAGAIRNIDNIRDAVGTVLAPRLVLDRLYAHQHAIDARFYALMPS